MKRNLDLMNQMMSVSHQDNRYPLHGFWMSSSFHRLPTVTSLTPKISATAVDGIIQTVSISPVAGRG